MLVVLDEAVGAHRPATKQPAPQPEPHTVTALPSVTSQDWHLAEELCPASSLPDEHPGLLAARLSMPICSRGTAPNCKLSDNFTGAKRAWV